MPTAPATCLLVAAVLLTGAGLPAAGIVLAVVCSIYEFVLPWLAQ